AVEIWSIRPSPVHRMSAGPAMAEASTWPLDLSPDGRWLASVVLDKGLLFWDLVNGTPPAWLEMPGVRLLSFHPGRSELFLTSATGVRRLAFDATAAPPKPRLGEPTTLPLPKNFSPQWLALSGNGRTMALGSFFEGRTF